MAAGRQRSRPLGGRWNRDVPSWDAAGAGGTNEPPGVASRSTPCRPHRSALRPETGPAVGLAENRLDAPHPNRRPNLRRVLLRLVARWRGAAGPSVAPSRTPPLAAPTTSPRTPSPRLRTPAQTRLPAEGLRREPRPRPSQDGRYPSDPLRPSYRKLENATAGSFGLTGRDQESARPADPARSSRRIPEHPGEWMDVEASAPGRLAEQAHLEAPVPGCSGALSHPGAPGPGREELVRIRSEGA
jgi:hypothetical protein